MDKANFELRLSKCEALNQERIKRALQIMKNDVVNVLNVLPVLLHYNSPNLPGYRSSSVPFGIDRFTPTEYQRRYLIDHGIDPDTKEEKHYPIYALYAMGSTSSIAQGQNSDLDIWVCVSKNTPSEEIRLLAEKCHFLSSFAKTLGADVNLFVTPEDKFLSGEHGNMDTEDCGSAQSLFLLDEFYRSSIRLCGRNLAWFMISEEDENQNYAKFLAEFYESPFVDKDAWFDFGSVAKCSPVEYFGSGLWLVYKGIDHPLKAVLKILLMEAYADEYPNTRLLSMELKSAVYNGSKYSIRQDAYYLMYRKVSRYLKRKGDASRLKLARFCFYIKIQQSIVHISKGKLREHRERFIRRLSLLWGWSRAYCNHISNIEQWHIENSKKAQQDLFSSLLESYRTLLRFSVENKIEYAITSDDAGVLSRKIYAAFDRYPGKILIASNEFIHQQEENTITFVKPSKHSICRKGWHIFPTAIDSLSLLSTKAVYIAPRAVEVVAWATFNNLLTSRSKVYVSNKDGYLTSDKIKQLSYDMSLFFKNRSQLEVSEADLQKPRKVLKSMLLINLENDITQELLISPSDIEIGSSLSCGRQKMCLVGSVDLVCLNSWGEINCISYPDGELGLVEALSSVIRIHTGLFSNQPHEYSSVLKVLSYSKAHSDLIRFDLEATIRGIFACLGDYESSYVFNVGHNTYESMVNEEGALSLIRHSTFRTSDDDVTVLSRFGMRPEFALQVPTQVEKCASAGIVQYFFKKNGTSWDIYIVNERNEVKIFHNFSGSRSKLVNAINRFYTQNTESDVANSNLNFNLPQYFVLSEDEISIHPFTIMNAGSS